MRMRNRERNSEFSVTTDWPPTKSILHSMIVDTTIPIVVMKSWWFQCAHFRALYIEYYKFLLFFKQECFACHFILKMKANLIVLKARNLMQKSSSTILT